MPLLSQADKDTIKHYVPSASNKIITAAIAKLYISLPNSQRWTDTGLIGAAVLAYDQVGKCFFFKLVDVVGSQGILWDQELYEGFQYNQDRTFFHSFEIPDSMAGFSFADEREASNFYSKVDSRQKKVPSGKSGLGKMGSKMKGLFGKSDKQEQASNHTASPLPHQPMTPEAPRKSTFDPNDPEMAGVLQQLAALGISEDQIAGNEDFIKSFITQQASKQQSTAPAIRQQQPSRVPVSQNVPPASNASPRAPAPPPPPGPPAAPPSHAPAAAGARKLPPPASATISNRPPIVLRRSPSPAPSNSAEQTPVAQNGRKAGGPPPPPPSRRKGASDAPAIPSKVPLADDAPAGRVFNVPPPFEGKRVSAPASGGRAVPAPPSSAGPPVPARGSTGPPVPSRQGPPLPPAAARPTSLPPRAVPGRPVPPPVGSGPPPAPPMPPMGTSSAGGPPPPPPPGPPPPNAPGGPPAPPAPSLAASLPPGAPAGRDDLLASIRGAGGLKKLKKTETVDKSSPLAAAGVAGAGAGAGMGAAAAAPDMASQLAMALGQRNKKVAVNSEGEESDEDW